MQNNNNPHDRSVLDCLTPATRTVVVADGFKSKALGGNLAGTFVDTGTGPKAGRAVWVSMVAGKLRARMGPIAILLTHEGGTTRYVFPREVTELAAFVPPGTSAIDGESSFWIEDLQALTWQAHARSGGSTPADETRATEGGPW